MVLLISVFNAIMRKVLNVKRRKVFGNDHVNELHKKGDVFFRGHSVVAIIVAVIVFPGNPLAVAWASIVAIAFGEIFRAFVEWKYKKDTNDYLYTIFQMIFILTVFYVILDSHGLGLFDFRWEHQEKLYVDLKGDH
ncbi:DUF4181 domain-containing protein [Lentibacillus sp.]|jgi:hypothetical protein|uniref:DUF4181 domain-containing protein n=1 Tax=Lentibacillus sp. TaxID=1925746 RepID=UPI002B4B0C5B|nr:DUF4181 domain-containing protein [Lentibacillus sp.]HLS09092.1 DUF4181 domain-containing protein [Lentibacillus sp.]